MTINIRGKINNINNLILNFTLDTLVILLLFQDVKNQKISLTGEES